MEGVKQAFLAQHTIVAEYLNMGRPIRFNISTHKTITPTEQTDENINPGNIYLYEITKHIFVKLFSIFYVKAKQFIYNRNRQSNSTEVPPLEASNEITGSGGGGKAWR